MSFLHAVWILQPRSRLSRLSFMHIFWASLKSTSWATPTLSTSTRFSVHIGRANSPQKSSSLTISSAAEQRLYLFLSQIIRRETTQFIEDLGIPPRVILLENHGIITLGRSPEGVRAAMFMAEKAAQIFAGAVAFGGPQFLSEEHVSRIGGRPDEHHRQRVLRL